MNSIVSLLKYLFRPLPAHLEYSSPLITSLLLVCAALLIASVGLRFWRKKLRNPITKKLTQSWSGVSLGLSLVGFVLVVSRVEGIQYLAMRFFWVIWAVVAALYVVLQLKLWRSRYYQVLPRAQVVDPRDQYLPKAKKH